MIAAGIGLFIGILIGAYIPWSVSYLYAPLVSVAIMACLDSVLGGLRAQLEGKFDNTVFFSGILANALLAVVFVFIGARLGIDIYYVALLCFGLRIFNNTAAIRRIWLIRRKNKMKI